jgi:pimeloyl-ACP methyl ester carboxylesterase
MASFPIRGFVVALIFIVGCGPNSDGGTATKKPTLIDARLAHKTQLIKEEKAGFPVANPPSSIFRLVHYESPVGRLPAYVSKPPMVDEKLPAIIWLVGGFSNSISSIAWADPPKENDQSAGVFRKKGILVMYPSLRGGNENPGYIENFYGEVDDVIAAARYLATVENVDSHRIYLGGHSTGGTLALLVAESTKRFRAVFALGPTACATNYGQEFLSFDVDNETEVRLRAPFEWLSLIETPTYVFEGADGNIGSLNFMRDHNTNGRVHFYTLQGCDHFSGIAPVSDLIASKILRDKGLRPRFSFSKKELVRQIGEY